jgi:hypothetical protein
MEIRAIVRRRQAVLVSIRSAIPSLIGSGSRIGAGWDFTDYVSEGFSVAVAHPVLASGESHIARFWP